MRLTQDKKDKIIDFLVRIKEIRLLKKAPYIAEYDRENEVIKINTSIVSSTSDFLYVLAHEVVHGAFEIMEESVCDEIALWIANTDFFKKLVKNFFPNIWSSFTKR